MDTETESVRPRRRRPRSIVFFDHGEPSVIAKTIQNAKRKSRGFRLLSLRTVLRVLLIWVATLTLGGVLLRGAALFCENSPWSMDRCSSQWIQSQEALLDKYEPGHTPLTRPLQELTKLSEMSPSLGILGRVMSLVSANLSKSYNEIHALSDTFQVPAEELENLAVMKHHVQAMAERFSKDESYYRQSKLLWHRRHINVLEVGIDTIQQTLNGTSTSTLALREHALHRLPYGVRWSLAKQSLEEYAHFARQQESGVEVVFIQANEVDHALGDFVSLLGQFEGRLEQAIGESGSSCGGKSARLCKRDQMQQLRAAIRLRTAVVWCQDVVQAAKAHYWKLLLELSRSSRDLKADVQGYQSWWPAKSVVSVRKLDEMLRTERRQLDSFIEATEEAQDVMERFNTKVLLRGGEFAMPKKLMAAVEQRKLRWW